MSFILDALKKSDAKRRAQAGPDLATPWTPPQASRRSRWVPFVVGTLVLVVVAGGGAGLSWWWLQDRSTLRPVANQEPPTESQSSVQVQSPEPSIERSEWTSEPNPTVAPEASSQIQSNPSSDPTGATQLTSPNPVVQPSPSEANVVTGQNNSRTDSPQIPAESADQLDSTEDGIEVAETSWVPEGPDYLYQWELPLAIREALPNLQLVIHVYAERPEERFVLINGARFSEGEELGTGVTLAAIRPEGALIDFRDYRFLLTR